MDLLFIIFYIFLGILIGTITGLIPGLHPNTVCAIFLGFVFLSPTNMSVLLISVAVTHTFIDFIPSIMMGAPDSGTSLSVLPGHKMMMRGLGYRAIKLTVLGGIFSIFIIILLIPLIFTIVSPAYELVIGNIHLILIIITLSLFIKDRSLWGVFIFLISGFLGYIVLNGNFLGRFEILPLLTGFFGLSMITKSIMDNIKIPIQKIEEEKIRKKDIAVGSLVGSLSGLLVGFLPGIGAAQATFISQQIIRDESNTRFMISLGGVNTAVAIFSMLSLWVVGRPRSGVSVAVKELVGNLNLGEFVLFLGVVVLVGGVSSIITLKITKTFIKIFRKINYKKLAFSVMFFIITITFVFTGFLGIFVLFLSASIGMVCILTGTRRSYMMGSLILPIILFFI